MSQIFLSGHFVTMAFFSFLALIVCVLLYWKKRLSPSGYFLGGLGLIIIALITIIVLGQLDSGAKLVLDDASYSAFGRQYQIALYILPFISAAVGTNMISQAIIANKRG